MHLGDLPVLVACLLRVGFVIAFVFAPSTEANSRSNPAAACDHAAAQVAGESGVPLEVLRAITRAETGRGAGAEMQPWPWTVNMQGKGVWFDSEAQAQIYVFRHFQQGARSFDIGCFQINYKWHGHAFDSIEAMFDPMINARYAARYLSELFDAHGDWDKAVGAYHSRTRKHAQRYLDRYADIRREMEAALPADPLQTSRFPMLFGHSVQHVTGSLVPMTQNARGRLIDDGQGS